MNSIRTKVAGATIGAVVIIMIIAAVFGVVAVRNTGRESSEQMLHMLCEAGQKNLKNYITDLNDLAYADALTSLHTKGAFDIYVNNMQKGDLYLKETAETICSVFEHSPVFRIGGDEFAALLTDVDYKHRDKLIRQFDKKCEEKRTNETKAWEMIDVARGIAVYDPHEDRSVYDVIRRADRSMYENKWEIKRGRDSRS